MASETNIFRTATETEKKDFIEVGTVTTLDMFLDKLSRKRAECQKLYMPFDGYSARIDFEEKVRKAYFDGGTNLQKVVINIEMPDLEQYCKIDRFEFVGENDITEHKLLDNIKQSIVTGKEFNFRAKPRGNGITIFVPSADVAKVEERLKKEGKK